MFRVCRCIVSTIFRTVSNKIYISLNLILDFNMISVYNHWVKCVYHILLLHRVQQKRVGCNLDAIHTRESLVVIDDITSDSGTRDLQYRVDCYFGKSVIFIARHTVSVVCCIGNDQGKSLWIDLHKLKRKNKYHVKAFWYEYLASWHSV